MYLSVRDVKPLDEYKLLLTFENNEERIFDMKPYLEKGIFRTIQPTLLLPSLKP